MELNVSGFGYINMTHIYIFMYTTKFYAYCVCVCIHSANSQKMSQMISLIGLIFINTNLSDNKY